MSVRTLRSARGDHSDNTARDAAPAHSTHPSRMVTVRMGEYFFSRKIIRARVGDVLLVKN